MATQARHVKGTGPYAYPEQDEGELRDRWVREQVERIMKAHARAVQAQREYTEAMERVSEDWEEKSRAHLDAERRFARALYGFRGAIRDALEEAGAPAIHEVRP